MEKSLSGLIDEVANTLSVERTRSRLGKNRRTVGIGGSEPLALGPKGADDFGVAVYDPILAVHAASEVRVEAHARCGRCLRKVSGTGNAARQSRLELRDTADLPPSQEFARKLRAVSEQWQIIKIVEHEHVAGVELRRSPEHAGIVSVRHNVALVGTIIFAFR